MDGDIDKLKAAAANGLSLAETEAVLGHTLDKDEKKEWNKARAFVKLKAREDKKALAKPKRGSLGKPNVQGDKLAPRLGLRYKEEDIASVIEQTHGLTSSICMALDCTYQQWYVYLRRHPKLKQLTEECRQGFIDEAEKVVMENLNDDNPYIRQKAAEFVLSRMGCRRGWGTSPLLAVQIEASEQTRQIKAIFGLDQGNNEE